MTANIQNPTKTEPTADSIKALHKMGSHAFMASNSFPGASQLAKELGKDGTGVIVVKFPAPACRACPMFRARCSCAPG